MPAEAEAAFARVRRIVAALPETSERTSHGHPALFVAAREGRGGRQFAHLLDDHHGDGRLALWIAAPAGAQEALVDAAPDRFFRPPYVGHRGWLGVDLRAGVDDDELTGLLEDAYVSVAPARLARALDERS